MSDIGDDFRALEEMRKEERRERARRNGEIFDQANWIIHVDYHWGRWIDGEKLDFWPSKDKWMYRGKVRVGGLEDFLQAMNEPL